MRVFIKYIVKSMLEKKARLILLIFAIAMSSALFIGSTGAVRAGIDSFTDPIMAAFEGMDIRIESTENGLINPSEINQKGLSDMRAYINAPGLLQGRNTENISVYGMDKEWISQREWIEGTEDEGLKGNQALISYRTSRELNLETGDTIEILISGKIQSFEIRGITNVEGLFFTDTKDNFSLVIPIETADEMLNMQGYVNRITARSQGDNTKDSIAAFNDANSGYFAREILDLDGVKSQISQITSMFYAMLFVVIFMSALIIYGSFKLVITERLPVVGTFFSQGATKADIRKILFMESFLYGILGGIFGGVLGTGILYLVTYLSSPLREYGITGEFTPDIPLLLAGLIFSVTLSLISCAVPIIKTGRLQIKNVILGIRQQGKSRGVAGFIAGTVILFLIILSAILTPDFFSPLSAIFLFLSVAAVMLIYPRIVSFFTPLLFRGAKGISGSLALGLHNVESSKALRGNISLLILSILAMVTIHSVGMSLQDIVVEAFTGMNYDYSVDNIRIQDPESLEALKNSLKENSYVKEDSVHSRMLAFGKINDTNSMIMGIDTSHYRDFNPYLGFDNGENKKIYDSFRENPEGRVIVSKNVAAISNVSQGDKITLEIEGRSMDYEVAGVVDGKLYFSGSFIMIENSSLEKDFHYVYVSDIYFHTTKQSAEVTASIEETAGQFGARVVSLDEAMQANLEGNRQLMDILGIFSLIAVVIGAFGALNNIIISFIQRKKDLAVLSSVGMTPGQRNKMILTESAVTVFWAILFITPYGYLMARLLTETTAMIGFPIPVEFSAAAMIPFFMAAFAIFLAATLPAVIKSNKLSVIREIQFE